MRKKVVLQLEASKPEGESKVNRTGMGGLIITRGAGAGTWVLNLDPPATQAVHVSRSTFRNVQAPTHLTYFRKNVETCRDSLEQHGPQEFSPFQGVSAQFAGDNVGKTDGGRAATGHVYVESRDTEMGNRASTTRVTDSEWVFRPHVRLGLMRTSIGPLTCAATVLGKVNLFWKSWDVEWRCIRTNSIVTGPKGLFETIIHICRPGAKRPSVTLDILQLQLIPDDSRGQ
ncbi:hypothetical protein BJ912DRAFT_928578 [Pholiota molesta]|nr:hypothetical protein BJ912DRAFT_928578 [Pholiota molesta]